MRTVHDSCVQKSKAPSASAHRNPTNTPPALLYYFTRFFFTKKEKKTPLACARKQNHNREFCTAATEHEFLQNDGAFFFLQKTLTRGIIIIINNKIFPSLFLSHPSMTLSDTLAAGDAGGDRALFANARYSPFMQPSTNGNGSTAAICLTRRYASRRTWIPKKGGGDKSETRTWRDNPSLATVLGI